MEITIPPNTTAIVYIPAKSINTIKENDQPVSSINGIKIKGRENEYEVVEVGSGSYHFFAVNSEK